MPSRAAVPESSGNHPIRLFQSADDLFALGLFQNLAHGMANSTGASLWPGYVATERMTQLMETDPGVKQLTEMGFESTELSGRVIRALYDDPNLLTLSGKTIITAGAVERYGVSDLDGYEPKSLREIYVALILLSIC